MWPFRKYTDEWKAVEKARKDIAEAEDRLTNYWQEMGRLKQIISELERPLTDDGVNQIAADLTAAINDYYARGAASVQGRTQAIHTIIATAVRKVVRGDKLWNEEQVADRFYREIEKAPSLIACAEAVP